MLSGAASRLERLALRVKLVHLTGGMSVNDTSPVWSARLNHREILSLPLTQGAEACLSSGLPLTLEPSDNLHPFSFGQCNFLSISDVEENNFTISKHIYH